MRRIRGKVIAVCTVIAIILAAREALTAEIPVVYAENGSDIDDAAVLEEDGEDEQDTENSASGDGENEDKDGDEKDGDTDKASGGVNSGTGSADGSRKDGDTDKAGGNVNSGKDSASDSQTDGGNKTDGKPDADTDDAEADSDADVKTEDDTLADAEEEPEETLPPAEIRSVFSLRSSRSTGRDIGEVKSIPAFNEQLQTYANEGAVEATLSADIGLAEVNDAITVPAGVDLTLKMNNCSLTDCFRSNAINVNGGTLTLTGKGSIECNNGYGIMIVGGNVTLDGNQTITSTSDNAIFVSQGGNLTISGGTIKGGNYGIFATESTVTINSGTVTGNRAACYISGGESVSRTLTINGGTFKATSGQSLYYAASKKATINGGTFTNGVGVELSKSSESIDSLSIGEWATRFYTKINGSFDNNTFRAMDTDSGYYYYIESSTGGKSGTWDGKYKEYRLLEPGKKYSFKDAGCKVSGDDSVYKACDFYFSGEGFYTFTKE